MNSASRGYMRRFVLVHGLFGFDSLRLGPCVVAHFVQGISEALRGGSNRVLVVIFVEMLAGSK